jgi:small subunit ribosomal protein S20
LAHHSATKKAIRTSAKRNLRNRAYKSKIKTAIKQFEEATTKEEKEKSLKKAQQILDRASKRNVIKRNVASRKISSMQKKLDAAETEAGAQ